MYSTKVENQTNPPSPPIHFLHCQLVHLSLLLNLHQHTTTSNESLKFRRFPLRPLRFQGWQGWAGPPPWPGFSDAGVSAELSCSCRILARLCRGFVSTPAKVRRDAAGERGGGVGGKLEGGKALRTDNLVVESLCGGGGSLSLLFMVFQRKHLTQGGSGLLAGKVSPLTACWSLNKNLSISP